MNDEILRKILEAQLATNDLIKQLAGHEVISGSYAFKKVGEIAITGAGGDVETDFTIPQEMRDISFFSVETNSKDLLIKRATLGLSIDGTQYFEANTPAKTFYFPEYNDVRMLDLREYSKDGKAIVSTNKKITVRVKDDASVSSPAFAAYKVSIFIKGISELR